MKRMGLALLLAAMASGAGAQSMGDRVGKLERELRAVQRTVFPGGTPVEPESAPAATAATPGGVPATSPVQDLTSRVDALEKGLASVTGQVEQAGNRLRMAEEAATALAARVAMLEARLAPPAPVAAAPSVSSPPSSRPDPARRAAVAAVEMPATGDAAEDAYTYGFRLYAAKLYPEAQTALKDFIAKYPASRRASYARNLLGRAYFDEGKPALAALTFHENYEKLPNGERAGESLVRLGEALVRLKRDDEACKVYAVVAEDYASGLSAEMKSKAAKGRADAKCP